MPDYPDMQQEPGHLRSKFGATGNNFVFMLCVTISQYPDLLQAENSNRYSD